VADQPFTEEDVRRYAEIALSAPACQCLLKLDVPEACAECRIRAVLSALAEDGKRGQLQWALRNAEGDLDCITDLDVDAEPPEPEFPDDEVVQRWVGPWEPVPDTQSSELDPAFRAAYDGKAF